MSTHKQINSFLLRMNVSFCHIGPRCQFIVVVAGFDVVVCLLPSHTESDTHLVHASQTLSAYSRWGVLCTLYCCRNRFAQPYWRTHMVKTWAGPSRPWDCTSVRRKKSAAVRFCRKDEDAKLRCGTCALFANIHISILCPLLLLIAKSINFSTINCNSSPTLKVFFQTWIPPPRLVKFSWLQGRLTPN